MKRSIGDFFKREYEVRLSVNSRDTVSSISGQQKGIAVLSPDGEEVFRSGNTAAAEETFALIRDLDPEVFRFFAESPDFDRWLGFCSKEGISPHIVFPAEEDPEKMKAAAEKCISAYAGRDPSECPKYYEIVCDTEDIPFDSDEAIGAAVRKMKDCAALLRAADPDGRIILGGMASGTNPAKAEVWNTALLEKCAGLMDMLGVTLYPSAVSGRVWDENEDGIEAAFAMAEELRNSFGRLENQIHRAAPNSGIRLAVTGWGPLQDNTHQKRQDCVFFASVYRVLRMACGQAGLFEAGPLFGNSGLLRFEDGMVFGDVFYHSMLITSYDLPVCMEIKEAEFEQPVPSCHWDGVPGIFDSSDMKLLDVFASRTPDGKKLFLLLTNRTPFRRAVTRIRFYGLPDLHPVKACSMRSPKRLDENSASAPLNVYCKEIKLRKYRNMDHVTLDILECSTVCMLLEV